MSRIRKRESRFGTVAIRSSLAGATPPSSTPPIGNLDPRSNVRPGLTFDLGSRFPMGGVEDGGVAPARLDRIATVPNLLSLFRILLIPAFVALILHHGTQAPGLRLLPPAVAAAWG